MGTPRFLLQQAKPKFSVPNPANTIAISGLKINTGQLSICLDRCECPLQAAKRDRLPDEYSKQVAGEVVCGGDLRQQ
jgi:hypothetical protein